MRSLTEQAKDFLLARLTTILDRDFRDGLERDLDIEPGGDLLPHLLEVTRAELVREEAAERERLTAAAVAHAEAQRAELAELLAPLPCRVSIASHRTIRLRARVAERGGLSFHVTGRWHPVAAAWLWSAKLIALYKNDRDTSRQYDSGAAYSGLATRVVLDAVLDALAGTILRDADRVRLEAIDGRLRAHMEVCDG